MFIKFSAFRSSGVWMNKVDIFSKEIEKYSTYRKSDG